MSISCVASSIIYLYIILLIINISIQIYASYYYYSVLNIIKYQIFLILGTILVILVKIIELVSLFMVCSDKLTQHRKYCCFLLPLHIDYETSYINTNTATDNYNGYICHGLCNFISSIISLIITLLQLLVVVKIDNIIFDKFGNFILIFSSITPFVQIITFIILIFSEKNCITNKFYIV